MTLEKRMQSPFEFINLLEVGPDTILLDTFQL